MGVGGAVREEEEGRGLYDYICSTNAIVQVRVSLQGLSLHALACGIF